MGKGTWHLIQPCGTECDARPTKNPDRQDACPANNLYTKGLYIRGACDLNKIRISHDSSEKFILIQVSSEAGSSLNLIRRILHITTLRQNSAATVVAQCKSSF